MEAGRDARVKPVDARVADRSKPAVADAARDVATGFDAVVPPPRDAGSGGDAAPGCVDSTHGVVTALAPGLPTSAVNGYFQLHSLVADEAGAYLTASVTFLKAPTQELLFVTPAVDAAPGVVQTSGTLWSYAVAAGKAWYFDGGGVLQRVDLATGQSEQSVPTRTSVPFGYVATFGSRLYWVGMDPSPVKYRLVRASVATDGSVGTPEPIRESAEMIGPFAASSLGVAWREGRDIVFQPAAGAPETVMTFDTPETNGRIALNTTALYLTVNGFGPSRDGGCIRDPGTDAAPACTSYPGDFLGAKIVAWDPATHLYATLAESQTAEMIPVAATDDAVYWAETTIGGSCSTLWSRALGSTNNVLIASGDNAPRDLLTANSKQAYWLGASNTLQHYP